MENRYDYGIGYYKYNDFSMNEWKIVSDYEIG